MIGVYYLHENGDLIYKHGEVDLEELLESDFVQKFWVMPDTSPTGTPHGDKDWIKNFLREAHSLSRNKPVTLTRILTICRVNGFDWTESDFV